MEQNPNRYNISRRSLIGSLAGAAFLGNKSFRTTEAPSEKTSGGGAFCTTAPNDEGIQKLASIHDIADTDYPLDRYEIAERCGFTLIDRDELWNFVRNDILSTDRADVATQLLSEFTSKHLGISCSITQEVLDYAETQSEYSHNTLIDGGISLLVHLSVLPREFYDTIRFTNITIDEVPDGSVGTYDLDSGNVSIHPTSLRDTFVLFHEIGHAAHMTHCGFDGDEAIQNTLPEGIDYTRDWRNTQYDSTVFYSDYGQSSDLEDAATIISAWITGRIGLSNELEGTSLYQKLAIIMDQFDTLLPGIVHYIEGGVRPLFQNNRSGA